MKNNMINEIHNLPAKQQVALWVILKNYQKNNKTVFSTSDFSRDMEDFLIPKKSESLGKIVGGILSSLVRNNIIKQLAGGRDTIWTINLEIQNNAKEFEEAIFPVTTYWMDR